MRTLVTALVLLLVAHGAEAQGVVLEGRRCATPEMTIAQGLQAQRATRAYRAATAYLRADDAPITIPVAVHILRAGPTLAQGDVPPAWIEAQIDTLNSAFAGVGLRFALALVQRVDNAVWYDGLSLGSPEERDMKRALALDPARVLNLYSVSPSLDFLGWATLPDASAERDDYQGVVVLDQSLPGGDAAPYDLGHTGTHEVGHWAGLAHTFSGGCSSPNDGVADTPQERSGASGCPTTRDSCPLDPGLDPVHNYMDYSDDACMTEFTGGQTERVRALMSQFRPTIAQGGYALATLPRGSVDAVEDGGTTSAVLRVTNATAGGLRVVDVQVEGAALVAADTLPEIPAGEAGRIELVAGSGPPLDLPLGAVSLEAVDPLRPDVRVEVFVVPALLPRAQLEPASAQLNIVQLETDGATARLVNVGRGPLFFEVDEDSLPPYVAAVRPASGTISPGTAVTFEIELAPGTIAPGDYADAVTVRTNDPAAPTLALAVPMTVLLRPAALVAGRVFPNPTRGPVTIPLELPDSLAIWADVIDLRGRVVAVLAASETLPVGYPELRWDASRMAPGLYLVRVRTATEAALTRVTITR